jgi:uroporphyrinogen decarboxylase
MALTERDNFLRNASMTGPEWMPIYPCISGAAWVHLGAELEDIVARHPVLFPTFQKGGRDYPVTNEYGWVDIDVEATDSWGCRWHHNIQGIIGQVVEHPLDEWDKFDGYTPPDPLTQDAWGHRDWEKVGAQIAAARERGELTIGELGHGFLFMRLHDLRGYENLMEDYGLDEPRLHGLIDMLVAHQRVVVQQYLHCGVDLISAGDDLGTQTASMISPATFHKWITPAYTQLFGLARAAGKQVLLHSDGHMIELMDELIAAGVTICNPQDLCNGIDEIKAAVDGRICVRLDIDRQSVVPFGTPREIRDLVEEAVRKLGSPRGGLELVVGIYPPTPPENIEALFSAFEEFRTYWFDGRGET